MVLDLHMTLAMGKVLTIPPEVILTVAMVAHHLDTLDTLVIEERSVQLGMVVAPVVQGPGMA